MGDTTHPAPDCTGRDLACLTVQAEPLRLSSDVRHDASYVAQLLAYAADIVDMPQRRRADRTGALSAYAAATAAPAHHGLTRRII